MNDLTQVENVVKLMKSSNSESEWNNNCDLVKKSIMDTRHFGIVLL